MKYVLIIFFLILLVYLSFTWRKQLHRFANKFIHTRHQQLASMFEATPLRANAIIFLGDSITEGANWQELLNNPKVINRGIGGDTTSGVLNRIDEVIRHHAEKIFICIGTNDIGQDIATEKIMSNYALILDALKERSSKTEIFVQSILPVNIAKNAVFRHNNKGILAVNEQLEMLCSARHIKYIDLHTQFVNSEGKLKKAYTNDGLHLLGNAYLKWVEIIKDFVQK